MNKILVVALGVFAVMPSLDAMEVKEKSDIKSRLDNAMEQGRPRSEEISKAIKDAIESGNVNVAFGPERLTPLHLAVSKGTKEDVESLLRHRANVRAESSPHGYTPLHFVILSLYRPGAGDLKEVVELLLANGASLTAVDNLGNTPLHLVRSKEQFPGVINDPELLKKYLEIDEFLVKQGASEDVENKHGQTPKDLKYKFVPHEPVRRVSSRSERVITEPMEPELPRTRLPFPQTIPYIFDVRRMEIVMPAAKENLP